MHLLVSRELGLGQRPVTQTKEMQSQANLIHSWFVCASHFSGLGKDML